MHTFFIQTQPTRPALIFSAWCNQSIVHMTVICLLEPAIHRHTDTFLSPICAKTFCTKMIKIKLVLNKWTQGCCVFLEKTHFWCRAGACRYNLSLSLSNYDRQEPGYAIHIYMLQGVGELFPCIHFTCCLSTMICTFEALCTLTMAKAWHIHQSLLRHLKLFAWLFHIQVHCSDLPSTLDVTSSPVSTIPTNKITTHKIGKLWSHTLS